MRFLLKIMFAPLIAVLAIAAWAFGIALSMSAWVFGIAGTVLSILGFIVLVLDNVINGTIILVIAFLVSPMGLPMVAAWLIGQMQRFRFFVQEAIYN